MIRRAGGFVSPAGRNRRAPYMVGWSETPAVPGARPRF